MNLFRKRRQCKIAVILEVAYIHIEITIQIISYALTLSYSSNKEHETLRIAVRACCTWLNALTKTSTQAVLPKPMKRDPARYICFLLDSLRTVFVRVNHGSEMSSAAIRQAHEMENILRTVVDSSQNCDEGYKYIIWPAVLKFLLNASDLLLSGQSYMVEESVDDIATIMAPKVTKTLLDGFLCAARLEHMPSPAYWKTLSVLSKRWRHQVSFIENWARKVLSLSVIIVQEIYGERYLDEEVQLFAKEKKSTSSNDDTLPILHICWFQLMHMVGNPASIISFEPRTSETLPSNLLSAILVTDGAMDGDGNPLTVSFNQELTEFTTSCLKRCFFMTSAAVMKLVDVFYGDSHVTIDFRESDELLRQWSDLNRSVHEDWVKHHHQVMQQQNTFKSYFYIFLFFNYRALKNYHFQTLTHGSSHSVNAAGDSATLTAAYSNTGISGVTGIGLKNALNVVTVSKSRAMSERSLAVNMSMPSPAASSAEEASPGVPKPNSAQFIWHYLHSNRVHKPYIGERQPKVSRMLDTFMDWLVQSSLARSIGSSPSGKLKFPKSFKIGLTFFIVICILISLNVVSYIFIKAIS
ncbi:unnamed protein product [Thelazia callipaeda]|uniref:RALGAPB_N domain-containing protein n=1 Tax=Thelazia callipaeda TaxID=103827 RepID=A0A0N5CRZ4_THECL|nr:unnamed protein product [Thelazia callipaeda]